MNYPAFIESLAERSEPKALNVYLIALWHDALGDWHKAHDMVQDLSDKRAARVHAYLHRKEGDVWNARYWYAKAGIQEPNLSLEGEWKTMIEEWL